MKMEIPEGQNTMFSCFADAADKRAHQASIDTKRATQINNEVRRNNPTMLETSTDNMVDFSNPESVARMQQPHYYNPYYNNLNNPNLRQQAPYGYNNPYGNFYAGYPQYGGIGYSSMFSDNAQYMIPSEDDISEGLAPKVRVEEVDEDEEEIIRTVTNHESYFERKFKKNQLKVTVVEEDVSDNILDSTIVRNFGGDKKNSIRSKLEDIKFDVSLTNDTKAVFSYSEEYEEEINDLAEQIAIYNEAIALCLVGSLDEISKEDFDVYKAWCIEKLNWYIRQEQIHPNIDYRLPYRYRMLPPMVKDKDSGEIAFNDVAEIIPEKIYDNNGNRIYSYDRGREPNDEEWAIFYNKATVDRDDIIKKRKAEIYSQWKKERDELENYNPYDPMSVRIYNIKKQKKIQQDQYDFYHHALGGSVSDKEFDKWWYGNNSSSSNVEQDPRKTRRTWIKQMTENNMKQALQIKPIDHDAIRRHMMNMTWKAVNDFDKGYMDGCTSLKDYFDRLHYLNVRVHEENLEKQRREGVSQIANKSSYNRSLYTFANEYHPLSDAERIPGVKFGSVDPGYGYPTNYVDFMKCDLYNERKQRFLNYCNNTQGHIPLRPIFK